MENEVYYPVKVMEMAGMKMERMEKQLGGKGGNVRWETKMTHKE